MHPDPNTARSLRLAGDRAPEEVVPRPQAPVIDIHDWNPSHAPSTRLESVVGPASDAPEDLVYEIDHHGRLTHVDRAWNRFAIENGAPELRAENVVGRSFWSFFDDSDGLVDEHRLMLDRCRERDQKGTFLLRCDAPEERRMLRMWIEPLDEGRFRFTSRTVAVESLDPGLYDRILRVADPVRVARCSHCNRFRVQDDWFEPEDAVRADWEREHPGRLRAMVHTLCPGCRQHLRAVPRLVATN